MNSKEDINNIYKKVHKKIESRLAEFEKLFQEGSEEALFSELVFCILTPQSKARNCWECVRELNKKDLILKGDWKNIVKELNRARFKNKKARYIISAREKFLKNGKLNVKSKIAGFGNAQEAREWLVSNIKGMGYKEASHFLRNTGLGEDIAILDRHILRNLKELGVINEIPSSISKKKYMEIEGQMKEFSKRVNIPITELDLLFWCKETGEVFK